MIGGVGGSFGGGELVGMFLLYGWRFAGVHLKCV